jgi:hypothetical protein
MVHGRWINAIDEHEQQECSYVVCEKELEEQGKPETHSGGSAFGL